MNKIPFVKLHGLGNDFIVVENFNGEVKNIEKLAMDVCHRRFGIGADGLMLVSNSECADIKMEIYNADGSYASMCGNGIRCFVKYVLDRELCTGDEITVETGDGVKVAKVERENGKVSTVEVNMGGYTFDPNKVPVKSDEEVIEKTVEFCGDNVKITSLRLGVTHTIVQCNLDDYEVQYGEVIEHGDIFPEKTNVNFGEVESRNSIRVKTWERGAGATLACGTGCCATVVAFNRLGLVDKSVDVEVPGGKMHVSIKDDGVYMRGPAEEICDGMVIAK